MLKTSTSSQFAAKMVGIIRSTPWNRAASLGASFGALALELFEIQFVRNAAYRRVCESMGRTPATVDDAVKIPFMPTDAFKELDLTCYLSSERTKVFHSSGTTQQKPSRHWHGAESLALYDDSAWQWFTPHVMSDLEPGRLRFISMTPHPERAPQSSLAHMMGMVAGHLGQESSSFFGMALTDGWHVEVTGLRNALIRAGENGKPVLLAGTAFQFVEWMDQCDSKGWSFSLPVGSRVMETGGYKGRTRGVPKCKLHEGIANCLGVDGSAIISEYGMSELSSQAYDIACRAYADDAKGQRRFQFPPWARAIVISPETGEEVAEGETGILRVLDLANVWSVAAVQTSDLAVKRGNGFDLIGRAARSEPRGCSLMTVNG